MNKFEQYLRLLLQLHVLMEEGNGDTDEADLVRDQMDKPWHGLSEREQETLSNVSEFLYDKV